jgi:hypothetical protein
LNLFKSERNSEKLSKLFNDLLSTQKEWNGQLSSDATAHNPKDEKMPIFKAALQKDTTLLGTIDQIKGDLKVKQAQVPGQKSSLCVVL